ncbi:phosphatase PAP2 family protein [Lichenihabitans sp. Uapishka_5]|uniref:phosphatase PAP2 family protein n=1 Tax=Lichenihabitans sp. Uapishka_5 TaxID=3037302 RepID=UPI0029E81C94|nr:phosphatase PAP2 family protein [Lichenihabitans sp. Uapishka_5]MDX7951623.1 phosphatase PAP2 family protein [Lichenihabitans sp. Uapishka_5]
MPTIAMICALATVVCVLCALLVDVPVARLALQTPPDLRAIAQVFSDIGLSGYMLGLSGLIAAAAFLTLRRYRSHKRRSLLRLLGERAFFVFAAVALSGIAVQIIKHVVGRARPKAIGSLDAFHFDLFSIKASLASFPSGHSTSIFALAAALGLIAPRLRVPAFGLAMLVALARVVLAAHYASDIVAGATLGVVTTLAIAGVFANRSIAFTRRDGVVRLKGRGVIWSALRLRACGTGQAA